MKNTLLHQVKSVHQTGGTPYKAFDQAGYELGGYLGVTDVTAKKMMREAYQEAEGRELYASGKALEKEHHQPRVEAERAKSRDDAAQPRELARTR